MQRDNLQSKVNPSSPGSDRQYEAWETLAPLNELQRDSIRELQKVCLDLPMSKKFLPEPVSLTHKALTLEGAKACSPRLGFLEESFNSNAGSRNSSPISRAGSSLGVTDLYANLPENLAKILPSKPTQSVSSFLLWFSTLEPNFLTNQDKSYKSYQDLLFDYKHKANSLLAELNTSKGSLTELLACQAQIQEQISPMRMQCGESLADKAALEKEISKIEAQLRPFEQLSQIHQFLSRPGNDLCMNARFGTILQQLDTGIAFMKEHTLFKDADLYLARYQQSMTRSLSLIHLYFSDRLEALKRTGPSEGVSFGAHLANNHQSFRYLASEMRPLICHIEIRSDAHTDHTNLLSDCHRLLLKTRLLFLKSHLPNLVVGEEIFDILIDGAAQMQGVLRDEESLFRSFFTEGEAELAGFLDEVLALFYELWSSHNAKRLVDRPATLNASATEAINFLGSQAQTLSTSFPRASQKTSAILNTINLRFPQL